MIRDIVPHDYQLTQKYYLGTPIRKYRFDTSRSFFSSVFSTYVQGIFLLLLGLACVAQGLLLAISTTVVNNFGWLWIWFLGAASVPCLFGLVMYFMGNRRLMLLNISAAFLSFLFITLGHLVFFFSSLQSHPITYLLIGLLLLFIGIFTFRSVFVFISIPRSILMGTEGCLVLDKLYRIRVLRWDRVTAVWNNKSSSNIKCNNGTKLTIYYRWPNAMAVRDVIYGKSFRHIRSRTMVAYEAGESVAFGNFTISQQGITHGYKFFAWESIRECEYMEDGVALLGKDDTRLVYVSLSSLPNAVVFVALVNSILDTRAVH